MQGLFGAECSDVCANLLVRVSQDLLRIITLFAYFRNVYLLVMKVITITCYVQFRQSILALGVVDAMSNKGWQLVIVQRPGPNRLLKCSIFLISVKLSCYHRQQLFSGVSDCYDAVGSCFQKALDVAILNGILKLMWYNGILSHLDQSNVTCEHVVCLLIPISIFFILTCQASDLFDFPCRILTITCCRFFTATFINSFIQYMFSGNEK